MAVQVITESATQVEAKEDGTIDVILITEGEGSSGKYTAETMERAAADQVFPAGLHAYMDHPTVTEMQERPERSVMDLCGTYKQTGQLAEVAEGKGIRTTFQPYPSVRDAILERIHDIGFSIRATADVSESDGKTVERLIEVQSVDLVTRAGRGGRAVTESARELIESTRRDLIERNGGEYKPRTGSYFPAAQVAEATDNDVRGYLSQAIDNAHDADDSYAHLDDFDDQYVYFRLSRHSENGVRRGIYRQSYTRDGVNVTLTGEPEEVKPESTFTPTRPEPDAQNPTTVGESASTVTAEEKTMVEINESELSQLRESAGRVETLETEKAEAETRAQEAEAKLAESERRDKAQAIVSAAFEGITAPKLKARLVESAARDTDFDAETFEAEVKEAAEELTPKGVNVHGFGETADVAESDDDFNYDEKMNSIFEGGR